MVGGEEVGCLVAVGGESRQLGVLYILRLREIRSVGGRGIWLIMFVSLGCHWFG